ncbi:shikimate dehydrogenase [Ideonella azotifigens]|nr:shikimate dehydrogenase [Ideonella azotifigens]MCD2339565.1 shikimate dehydrogenase [Ideonella azotifigens]
MPESLARYAVFGNPISHSRSPRIHGWFAEATGQALRYEALLAPVDGFAASLQAFADAGGLGCNVTVPFKFEAFALAHQASPRARLASAANFLRREGQGWWADNTDGAGLVRDLVHNAQQTIAGSRVLLIGAGGAAAGVLGPLLAEAPAELRIVNRSPDKALRLAASHRALAAEHGVALQADGLDEPGSAFDLVLNASASSLAGQASPVPAKVLGSDCLAVDLMYGPAARPFLGWAAQHGARGRDGLGMLVEQAAEAFALWRGMRPETGDVLARLRAEVDAAA